MRFRNRERSYGEHFYRALPLIDQNNPNLNQEITNALQSHLIASIRFASNEVSVAKALPANLDDLYDLLTEAGDLTWRPSVPDDVKAALVKAATDNQKTESPLKGQQQPASAARPPAGRPAPPPPAPAKK